VFTNLTPGDHFIMAHHKNTCIDATAVFHIDQIDPLAISIDLGKLNEIVATTTGGSGVYHYSVNGEDMGSNNKYIYYRSGDYTVTVTDSNGCVASVTKHFDFIDIEIPNVFTPNGSGTNDTWKPTKTENYPDIQFVVYDRYGREVGKFGAGQSWDGKYKGTELPMGDYWYVLKLRNSKDDREFIGHFTLYR
jgi:gliding motility-associated-like protein